jgi:voltage-gated hydrogen channel 1
MASYFRSKFHCFDAAVIIAGFIIDVVLKGIIEEVASIVVILRLWRVLKIVEELSEAAEEQMEGLRDKISELEKANEELKHEMRLHTSRPSS